MVDSHLKEHLNLFAKAGGPYRYKDGRAFFPYPIIFIAFGMLGALSIHLSSFGHTQRKNVPMPPSWPMEETPQCSD